MILPKMKWRKLPRIMFLKKRSTSKINSKIKNSKTTTTYDTLALSIPVVNNMYLVVIQS